MKKFWIDLQPRQIAWAFIAGAVLMGGLVFNKYVAPARDEWEATAAQLDALAGRYAQLRRNLAMREKVDGQFEALAPAVVKAGSSEKTLSEFLRQLQRQARQPSMMVANIKPERPESHGAYEVYRVRMTVSGKMQEVSMFVADVMNEIPAVGLESFSLRGSRGAHMVECTLSLRMVRLVAGTPGRAGPTPRQEAG